jgi:acyl dehydratase
MHQLEDIDVGMKFTSARRTITEADVVAFAGITGGFNPLHTDELFAREETPFGQRIAHGLLLLSISYGLNSVRDNWKILALVECQRRFRAPVFFGDTIWGEYEVVKSRTSRSRPDIGLVTLKVQISSDRSDVVQEGHDVLMLATRLKCEAAVTGSAQEFAEALGMSSRWIALPCTRRYALASVRSRETLRLAARRSRLVGINRMDGQSRSLRTCRGRMIQELPGSERAAVISAGSARPVSAPLTGRADRRRRAGLGPIAP